MENNQYQQTQYQQAYQYQPVQAGQPIDPNYSEKAKDFLTKAIVSCAIAFRLLGACLASSPPGGPPGFGLENVGGAEGALSWESSSKPTV